MIARLLGSGFVFFLAVWPATATKYNIADSTSTLSIKGFIETNGKTGVLSESDIVSWSLTITGHGPPITLDKGSSTLSIVGRALSATEKSLTFDHSEHLEQNSLGLWNVFEAPILLRKAGIGWVSADPKKPASAGSPGFTMYVFRSEFYLDISQSVGRTGIEIIATAP